MSSYNHVSIMGHLTRDPKLTEFEGGCVANFGIAMNEVYYDKDGEKQEKVIFVDVEAWNRQAEIAEEFLQKGSPILVHGGLKFDTWENDDNEKRSKLSVRAQRLVFVGSRNDDENENENENDSEQSRSSSSKGNRKKSGRSNRQSSSESNRQSSSGKSKPAQSDDDDEIPF